MKAFFLFLLLLIASITEAQIGRQVIETDSGQVVLHFFAEGGKSTLEWTDKDGREGRSIAFDRNGNEIYSSSTRRFAGHESVRFSYHPDGSVAKAEYSTAPDAGIQWHKSTTDFDQHGNQIGYKELGRDNYGIYPRPGDELKKDPQGQRMFVNEVFLVNATRKTGKAHVVPKEVSPAMKEQRHTIAPVDTIRLGTYSKGEVFPPPEEHVQLEVIKATLRSKKRAHHAVIRTKVIEVSPEHRQYFMVITGWKKR